MDAKKPSLTFGRRTRTNVLKGKVIRKDEDGADCFEDYWTDSDSADDCSDSASNSHGTNFLETEVSPNNSVLHDSDSGKGESNSKEKENKLSSTLKDLSTHSKTRNMSRKIKNMNDNVECETPQKKFKFMKQKVISLKENLTTAEESIFCGTKPSRISEASSGKTDSEKDIAVNSNLAISKIINVSRKFLMSPKLISDDLILEERNDIDIEGKSKLDVLKTVSPLSKIINKTNSTKSRKSTKNDKRQTKSRNEMETEKILSNYDKYDALIMQMINENDPKEKRNNSYKENTYCLAEKVTEPENSNGKSKALIGHNNEHNCNETNILGETNHIDCLADRTYNSEDDVDNVVKSKTDNIQIISISENFKPLRKNTSSPVSHNKFHSVLRNQVNPDSSMETFEQTEENITEPKTSKTLKLRSLKMERSLKMATKNQVSSNVSSNSLNLRSSVKQTKPDTFFISPEKSKHNEKMNLSGEPKSKEVNKQKKVSKNKEIVKSVQKKSGNVTKSRSNKDDPIDKSNNKNPLEDLSRPKYKTRLSRKNELENNKKMSSELRNIESPGTMGKRRSMRLSQFQNSEITNLKDDSIKFKTVTNTSEHIQTNSRKEISHVLPKSPENTRQYEADGFEYKSKSKNTNKQEKVVKSNEKQNIVEEFNEMSANDRSHQSEGLGKEFVVDNRNISLSHKKDLINSNISSKSKNKKSAGQMEKRTSKRLSFFENDEIADLRNNESISTVELIQSSDTHKGTSNALKNLSNSSFQALEQDYEVTNLEDDFIKSKNVNCISKNRINEITHVSSKSPEKAKQDEEINSEEDGYEYKSKPKKVSKPKQGAKNKDVPLNIENRNKKQNTVETLPEMSEKDADNQFENEISEQEVSLDEHNTPVSIKKDNIRRKKRGVISSKRKVSTDPKELRRSNRQRYLPLDHWRNERLMYRFENGQIKILGIDKGTNEDKAALLAIQRNMQRNVKQFHTKVKKGHVFDTVHSKKVRLDLLKTFPSVSWDEPASSLEHIPYRFKRVFDTYNSGFGFIEIDSMQSKPTQYMPNEDLQMTVIKGHIEVIIQDNNFEAAEKDMFIVPRGIAYSLKNLSSRKALLTFVVGKFKFINT